MVAERRHILLGLVGLAFTLVAWVIFILITAAAAYVEFTMPGGTDAMSDESPIAIGAGLALIMAVLLNLTGLVFATVGIFRRTQKRQFPLIAVFLGITLYAMIAALFLIGTYLA